MTADNEVDEQGLEAAADRLSAIGLHYHWWPGPPELPSSWRELDPIGRSEFLGVVEQVVKAYLAHSTRDGRA